LASKPNSFSNADASKGTGSQKFLCAISLVI